MNELHSLLASAVRLAVVASFLVVPVVPAAEEPQQSTAPIGQTQAAMDAAYDTKLICKRENVTGSNIPRRVCRTQAQIDADRAAAQRLMKEANSQLGRETAPTMSGMSENPMRP